MAKRPPGFSAWPGGDSALSLIPRAVENQEDTERQGRHEQCVYSLDVSLNSDIASAAYGTSGYGAFEPRVSFTAEAWQGVSSIVPAIAEELEQEHVLRAPVTVRSFSLSGSVKSFV